MNIRRNIGNGKRFIYDFVDFKGLLSWSYISTKIANIDMKDQYPEAKNFKGQQEEQMEAKNNAKINRNPTKNINKLHREITLTQFTQNHYNSKKMMSIPLTNR